MLIPLVGVLLSVALWSQWLSFPDPTVPQQSFIRRLGSTLHLTLDAWVVIDTADAVASRYEHLLKEAYSHTGNRAVVNISGDPGYTWFFGADEELLGLPRVWEPLPQSPTPPMSVPVKYWLKEGLADWITIDPADVPLSNSERVKAFIVSVVCTLFSVPWWAYYQVLRFLFAYTRRLIIRLEAQAEWILKYLEGQPQIARVQFVAEGDSPSSFDEELDLLIAGPRVTEEDILFWAKEEDSRPESVSPVSVLSQSGGIWIHQFTESPKEKLPLGIRTESDRKTTETANSTDGARLKPVLRLTWISPDMEDSDLDSPAPADGEPEKSTETDGRPSTPPVTINKKKNRPSLAARRRKAKQAREGEKELEKTLSEPPVAASSTSSDSALAPNSSTPLSALAPVFTPGHLAGLPQNGPLPSTPVPEQSGTNLPTDCGPPLQDFDGPSQRHKRHRRPRRQA